MTMMSRGASMLNRQAVAAAGLTDCVYTRKAGGSTVTLDEFIAGKSAQVSQPGPGEPVTRFEFTERDIIGPVSQLVQGSTPFLPALGDRWTETINGDSYTFEVKPAANLKAWDWSDQGRTRIRIRGKRV